VTASTRISADTRIAPDAPLAVTCGDPGGIGPDVALAAWAKRQHDAIPTFFVIAPRNTFAERSTAIGLDVPVQDISVPEEARAVFPEALPVLPVNGLEEHGDAVVPGVPSLAHVPLILGSIRLGVHEVLSGRAAGLVTNPIAKHLLHQAGFPFPGHTEYLAHLATEAGYAARRPVMLMASPRLRVIPATIHIPLAAVPSRLSTELIIDTAHIAISDFGKYFAMNKPRIAITGLNPHAGEQGDMGREDIDIIAPAVHALRAEGHAVTGPHSADTMFHEQAREGFDLVIAMYHDQALIPFKTLSFHDGVNVTLGLPFVRTSPEHGTAYDIAGTGRASPSSFVAALRLAAQMARNAKANQHG
jgi:4-hydroxythreonine-4-phosphate dehydrogenase